MSELIVSWLNTDVGLSRKVSSIERDFANGYLFGELLHKCGFVPCLEDAFRDEQALPVKRENFKQLKSVLQSTAGNLGIRLKEDQIAEIMQEDRGSSLRLLYQMRQGLLQRGPGRQAQPKAGSTAKVPKAQRGEAEERFFDHKLKTLRPIERQVRHEVHAKGFVDEHTRQMSKAAEMEATQAMDIANTVQRKRSQRLEAMSDKKAAEARTMEAGKATWHKVQSKKAQITEGDLRFEQEMIRREREKIVRARERHREETGYGQDDDSQGIHWFERNLQRIGIDTSEMSGTGAEEPLPEVGTMKELLDRMQEKLPTQGQLQVEAGKRMKKIKEAKRATDLARKERERRQNRVSVEQQATQVLVEEQRREEEQLAWLLKVTCDYRREAAEFDYSQRLKAAMWSEREARQTAKAARLDEEMEEAYQRTAAKAREEREAALAERRAAQDRARLRVAQGIVEATPERKDDVWTSEEEGEEDDEGGDARGGASGDGRASPSGDEAGDDGEAELVPAPELLACMRDAAVAEYVFLRGPWAEHRPATQEVLAAAAEAASEGQCAPRLGAITRWLCAPEEPRQAEAQLPGELPVFAIRGSPAIRGQSGVLAAVQRRLCADLQLAFVEPQSVLAECLALAEKPAAPEWPVQRRMYELGKEVLELGEQPTGVRHVPPQLVAEMIFRKIELLAVPPPKPVEEEEAPDPKKKKPPAKGKGKKEEEEEVEKPKPKGVIVAGFPADLAQQIAWEASLCGYTSPLVRLVDREADQQLQVSSILAPWWEESPELVLPLSAGAPAGAPLRLLDLRYPDHAQLARAVAAEAAGDDRPPSQSSEHEPPRALCEGFDADAAALPGLVDRAWLYEDAQALLRAFAAPLGTRLDLVLEPPDHAEGGTPLSTEDAVTQLARAAVERWLPASRHASEAEEGRDAEAPAEGEEAPADGGDAEAAADPADAGEAVAPWLGMDAGSRARLRSVWLETLSMYFPGVQQALRSLSEEAAAYNKDVVKMQRRFLEFLQRSDEKSAMLEDFLKTWPHHVAHSHPMEVAEMLEDISDRLWQLADRRRADAVDERSRLMTGGFWETKVETVLRLSESLAALENRRLVASASIIARGHGCEPEEAATLGGCDAEGVPSTLGEIRQHLVRITQHFAGTDFLECVARAVGPDRPTKDMIGALHAEQLKHLRRLKTIGSLAFSRLQTMRSHLDEAFGRMDDWIRDRVKVENNAIKAAMTQLQSGPPWEEEAFDDGSHSPVSPGKPRRKRSQSSPGGGQGRRRRREVLKALEPCTLDVDVFQPPSADDGEHGGEQRASVALPSVGRGSKDATALVGTEAPTRSERWPQAMLCGLMQQLLERGGGAACVPPGVLLEVLMRMRNQTLSFEAECMPRSWALRSEASWRVFCEAFVSPEWGSVGVDVTELLLALTFHGRQLGPPSDEALEESLQLLKSPEAGVSEEELEAYPDVGVSEALFLKLPLWPAGDDGAPEAMPKCEQPEALRRWIFRVLRCFEDGSAPELLVVPGQLRVDESVGAVSARRLFGYLSLGPAPSVGLRRALRTLLPVPLAEGPPPTAEGDGATSAAPAAAVRDVARVLFGGGRPAEAVRPAPELLQLCKALLPEAYDREAWLAAKETAAAADPKAKAKAAPKKGAPPPEPAADKGDPPPPPEEATLSMGEAEFLRHPAVVQALLTHGAAHCWKRVVAALFSDEGRPVAVSAAQLDKVQPLASLIPPPAEPAAPAEPAPQ